MSDKQKEARRLLRAVDCMTGRLSDKEKNFVIDMMDKPEYIMTPKQIEWLEIIAKKHDIY